MRFSLLTSLSLSLLTLSTAQSQFENSTTITSPPFYLQITHSHNRTLNGTFLSACHEGAAIGSICVPPKPVTPQNLNTYQQFRLNYTSNICGYDNGTLFPCTYPGDPTTGVLTWDLHYGGGGGSGTGNDSIISQSVQLVPQGYSSNLAFATIFFPSHGGFGTTYFSFDNNGKMGLRDRLDKKHPAQSPDLGVQKTWYRWFVCLDYWMYYQWNHLVWVFGDGEPWDENCQEVDVMRVFV